MNSESCHEWSLNLRESLRLIGGCKGERKRENDLCAERRRFELLNHHLMIVAFRVRCIQPLCHLSVRLIIIEEKE